MLCPKQNVKNTTSQTNLFYIYKLLIDTWNKLPYVKDQDLWLVPKKQKHSNKQMNSSWDHSCILGNFEQILNEAFKYGEVRPQCPRHFGLNLTHKNLYTSTFTLRRDPVILVYHHFLFLRGGGGGIFTNKTMG